MQKHHGFIGLCHLPLSCVFVICLCLRLPPRLLLQWERLWHDVEQEYTKEEHRRLVHRNLKWTEAKNSQIRLINRQRSVRTAGTITFDPKGLPLVDPLSEKDVWCYVPKLPPSMKDHLHRELWTEAKRHWSAKHRDFEENELRPQLFEAVRQSHFGLSRFAVKDMVTDIEVKGRRTILLYLKEQAGLSLEEYMPPSFEVFVLSKENMQRQFQLAMAKALKSGFLEGKEAEWKQPLLERPTDGFAI
jgi:hypothetical protein